MSRPVLLRLSAALLLLLSCAPFSPRTAPAVQPPTLASEPFGPSAVDGIEARFRERHVGIAEHEIRPVAAAIVEEAQAQNLSWELVLAVIHTESGFYNDAVSRVGALGLMQIMPATGESLAREGGMSWDGPESLFRPELNVRLGIRYLAWLRGRYTSWDRALAAYNWGPGHIDRRLRRGAEMPQRYASKVLGQLQSSVLP